MLAILRRWLGFDVHDRARSLAERLARLEQLAGPERAIGALTRDKGE